MRTRDVVRNQFGRLIIGNKWGKKNKTKKILLSPCTAARETPLVCRDAWSIFYKWMPHWGFRFYVHHALRDMPRRFVHYFIAKKTNGNYYFFSWNLSRDNFFAKMNLIAGKIFINESWTRELLMLQLGHDDFIANVSYTNFLLNVF